MDHDGLTNSNGSHGVADVDDAACPFVPQDDRAGYGVVR
jgi:hypothetical protein